MGALTAIVVKLSRGSLDRADFSIRDVSVHRRVDTRRLSWGPDRLNLGRMSRPVDASDPSRSERRRQNIVRGTEGALEMKDDHMIRVMIADDEEGIRDALSSLLDDDEQISLVGAGRDADQAIAIAAREQPDVALLDVRMPRGGGPRAAREIAQVSPSTELIALSANDDMGDIRAMLRAGAGAYLVKGEGTAEIVDAIHRSVEEPDGRTRWAALLPRTFGTRPFGSRERLRRIEAAVRGEGLEVVFQPIFDLTDGRPVGAEALSRFRSTPLRSPDRCFAEAAEVGLDIELEITAVRLAPRGLGHLHPPNIL